MTMQAKLKLIQQALLQREWTSDLGIHSPVCLWCGGYQRTPAMDQDYYGTAGHKPDCARQLALKAVEELLAKGTE